MEVKRVSGRILTVKLAIEGVLLNVINAYAPQVGCELEGKEELWSELEEVVRSIPTAERIVMGADCTGHVREGDGGDEHVMGRYRVGERNLEG